MDDNDDSVWPEDFIWPHVPRIAFGPGDEWRVNASLGWVLGSRRHAIHGYFEGYSRAASALLEWVRNDSTASPDYAVWPIAFLWRHHVELGLKRIIAAGRTIRGGDLAVPATHNLKSLWEQALPFIKQTGDDRTALANVKANIDEMVRLDPTSAGFRYPFEKDQQTTSLKDAPEHVNLAHLDEAMRAVSAFLDAVHDGLQAELEAQSYEY